MSYVDGFVIPLPKKNLKVYRQQAQKAGKIWRELGALEFRECAGDDLKPKGVGLPFPRLAKLKRGETVMFSWIVYKSRAHRDRVNARVMKDPRITAMMDEMPFDVKRMTYGGFEVIVDT
jgi:uncharacterized protein YbaA (DUF1428 family)